VLALALILFVLSSISFYTALTDGSPFEDFSRWCSPPVCSAGTVQRLHDGDTDEEIVMEPVPVAAPDLIMVSDDEEDPEEMIPEEDEPADQPNQEEQAPGEDLEDHHGPEVEEEEQEQEQDEAAEEVIWEVYHYRADGVGIPMADHL
jgi:hypothetical protein